MSNQNCGYCYNRGCVHCEPSLRAEQQASFQRRQIADRAAWRAYAAAYIAAGCDAATAFVRADEAMAMEAASKPA